MKVLVTGAGGMLAHEVIPALESAGHEVLPLAHIYLPAPSPTQSGRASLPEWVLEFEPSSPHELAPLMGWTGSSDPLGQIKLRFPDPQSAIDFAERQGWRYVVQEPERRHSPKHYSGHFRYNLADAITRAQGGWDGAVSINDRRETRDGKIGLSGAFPAHPRA